MFKKIRSLLVVPATIVLTLAVVVPPAAADSSMMTDTSGTSTSEPLTESGVHQQAQEMMQSLAAKHKNRQNATTRTRKCQAAKHGLETKLGNLQKNAAKHKALIDSVYTKVLAYQQKKNINPANFSSLTAAADTAKDKAAASVTVLDGLSVNLDCSSNDVASQVADFKVAAKQTRSDLLAYRKAVVAVIQSLESTKQ